MNNNYKKLERKALHMLAGDRLNTFGRNRRGPIATLLVALILLPSCAIIAPPSNNSKAWVYQQDNGIYRIALAGTVAFNPVGLGVLPTKNQRAYICTPAIEGEINAKQLRVFVKGGNWEPTETKSLSGTVSFGERIKGMEVDLHYRFKPKDKSAWNFNGNYKLKGNPFPSQKAELTVDSKNGVNTKAKAVLEQDSFQC